MTRRIARADTSSPSVPRVHGGQLVMRQSVAAAPGVPVLQANNIAKHYGGLKAVKGVSIYVQEGELRGLIGPNGAGKSQLLQMLAGEIEPTNGEVVLRDGNLPHQRNRQKGGRGIGGSIRKE